MTNDYPPLYVLRHGETAWNAEDRLQGCFDSRLTRIGVAQAEAQHGILAREDLTGYRALSSPQGRAFQTAAIAVMGHLSGIETDDRLREIGVGAWAGRLRHEIGMPSHSGAASGAIFEHYNRAPGGEGLEALEIRCRAFLKDLTGPSVLVTHGVTSRMLRLIVLGLPVREIATVDGGQGVVFHLENGVQKRLSKGLDAQPRIG
ncbi:MAG: histidine phosphatase family protein [Roseobacter sp.]